MSPTSYRTAPPRDKKRFILSHAFSRSERTSPHHGLARDRRFRAQRRDAKLEQLLVPISAMFALFGSLPCGDSEARPPPPNDP